MLTVSIINQLNTQNHYDSLQECVSGLWWYELIEQLVILFCISGTVSAQADVLTPWVLSYLLNSSLQTVAEEHLGMAENFEQLLLAVWREIARWKDAEKRMIAAQVNVDPSTLDSLDKM